MLRKEENFHQRCVLEHERNIASHEESRKQVSRLLALTLTLTLTLRTHATSPHARSRASRCSGRALSTCT